MTERLSIPDMKQRVALVHYRRIGMAEKMAVSGRVNPDFFCAERVVDRAERLSFHNAVAGGFVAAEHA